MKPSIVVILLSMGATALLGTSCQKSDAAAAQTEEAAPENAARFKTGEGVSLSPEMKKAIGLEVVEAGEEKINVSIHLNFTAISATQARSTISSEQAALIKPGTDILLVSDAPDSKVKGRVSGVEKILFGMPGDLEVIVSTEPTLHPGSSWKADLEIPLSGAVTVIPVSALLKTAEGHFVYTVNGQFYVRSPVKTGSRNDRFVEITDGLYSGDQVVATPVMSLWLAELQVLRGGKSCTCGH